MAKTRRKKLNSSPRRGPYRNSRIYVADKGDMVTTIGVRGRTRVTRVTNETGQRLKTIRLVEDAIQTPAKAVGERKPKAIFIGRIYTGVARSKPYPYRSRKRGASEPEMKPGLMARAAKAMKSVIVRDEVK